MAGQNGVVTPTLAAPGSEGVTVMLDKPRQVSLTLGTLYQAERMYERLGNLPFGTTQIFEDFVLQRLNATKLLVLLTCGLQAHDPMLTMDEVGGMVRMDRIMGVFDDIGKAWQEANPAPAPSTEESADASPPASTGLASGAEPATTSALPTPNSGA